MKANRAHRLLPFKTFGEAAAWSDVPRIRRPALYWRAPSGDTRGTQAKRFHPDQGRQRQIARHQKKRFGQLERDHGYAQHAQRIRYAEPGISAYRRQERHQEACRSDHGQRQLR
jgi:hypothetical protein